jgi:hypothetical protein
LMTTSRSWECRCGGKQIDVIPSHRLSAVATVGTCAFVFAMWEVVQRWFDDNIKKLGVQVGRHAACSWCG